MPKNPLIKFKKDLKDPKKHSAVKNWILNLLPSRKVIFLGLFFYFLGLFLASGFPVKSPIHFGFGFLTGNLNVEISSPIWTLEYFRIQFLDYLGNVAGNIFMSNMQVVLLCIFSGFYIIPSILFGLLSFSGALLYTLTANMGFKGVVMYLGLVHLHLEILAALLVIDAFVVFYKSIILSLWKISFKPFKKSFQNEFFPLIFKITMILALAAVLEVFWSTWWVYVFTHPYVSWWDFYLGVYSSKVF